MRKIYLFGANGYLGTEVKRQAQNLKFEVIYPHPLNPLAPNSIETDQGTVIYAAGPSKQNSSISDEKTRFTKSVGRAAELALSMGANFVFASTAQVYGDNLVGAVSEYTPPNPAADYARLRLEAEDFLQEKFSGDSLSNLRIGRLANGFGLRNDMSPVGASLVGNAILASIAMDKSFHFLGDPEAERVFVSISQLALGLLADDFEASKAEGGTVRNIGLGSSMTLREFRTLAESLHSDDNIEYEFENGRFTIVSEYSKLDASEQVRQLTMEIKRSLLEALQ